MRSKRARTRRTKPERFRGEPFVACAQCVNGWVKHPHDATGSTVMRCSCWQAHQERMQRLAEEMTRGR